MYDTRDIRPEDFMKLWPHQHKTLLMFTAELQKETRFLHEYSLASTKLVMAQMEEARTQIALEVDRLVGTLRGHNASMLSEFRQVADATLSDLDSRLKSHASSQVSLDQKIKAFENQVNAFQQKRRIFKALPWWTRAWRGITGEGL